MDHILRVTVIDSLKQRFHIWRSNLFRECLVFLLSDLLEKLRARYILHHQVDVLRVIVRFVVLDDIRVIKRVQNMHLLHYAINIVPQLNFIENLYGNLEIVIMLVHRLKDSSEGTDAQNFRLRVNMIVLLQLMNSLLLVSLPGFEGHSMTLAGCCVTNGVIIAFYGLSRIDAAHLAPISVMI